jgi:hypothetical protein
VISQSNNIFWVVRHPTLESGARIGLAGLYAEDALPRMREIGDRRARAGSFVLCFDWVSNHCQHDVRLTASPAGKALLVPIFCPEWKTQAVFVA